MNKEYIASVEIIDAALDEEAIRTAETAFRDKEGRFSGFELWHLARVVHRRPS